MRPARGVTLTVGFTGGHRMNSTQRRLHSYRQGRPAPPVAIPRLARGARVELDGERVRFDLPWPDLQATASLPKRPRGWIVVADDDPGGDPLRALERSDYATVRVARPRAGEWSDALAEAARRLATLPEARGLPIAIGGAGEHGHAAALAATQAIGPLAGALIRDREWRPAAGRARTLTLELDEPGDADRADRGIPDAALGEPAPAPQPRPLGGARAGARAIVSPSSARGPVRRNLRRALAVLASALAFTLGAWPARSRRLRRPSPPAT